MHIRFACRHSLWGLLAAGAMACTPPPSPPAPIRVTAPQPLYEEDLRPVTRPNLVITDLTETPSADKTTVIVAGVLVNRGSGPTRDVFVQVNALDREGRVVISTGSQVSTSSIPPGGTGRFSVTIEDRPEVDRYHVEAISR